MKKAILYLLGITLYFSSFSQTVQILSQPSKISFRGLSIAGNSIWISGSKGTVGRSANNGNIWHYTSVKGYENVDFRDIETLDENTAIIMGIASPAYILKTVDAGKTWKKAYENKDSAMFLDAMAFKNKKEGMVIGDPINQKIFVAETKDGGNSWQQTNKLELPNAINGEAFFAASGTNMVWHKNQWMIVSGGMASRLYANNKAIILPTLQGKQMTGANSIAVKGNYILIAGGDYENRDKADSAFVISNDGGKTFMLPATPPAGYQSCVCFASATIAVSCGLPGVFISYDDGNNWKKISEESFNTCAYNKKENAVYLAGNNGKLGKLVL